MGFLRSIFGLELPAGAGKHATGPNDLQSEELPINTKEYREKYEQHRSPGTATGTDKTWTAAEIQDCDVKIAVIGMTGAGKSTFIKLLTNDDRIRIGHSLNSETSDIVTSKYIDAQTGCSVMLIDTPGFGDNREGLTDIDLLQKLADFLDPMESGKPAGRRISLNGIIYMHNITDDRFTRVSKRSFKIFESLCGKDNACNIRIVTTNWSRVTKAEGERRERELETNYFKILIDAGAQMRRHENYVEPARQVISEFIPLHPIKIQFQEELQVADVLAETAAGTVLEKEMQDTQAQYERELEMEKLKDMSGAEEPAKQRDRIEQIERKLANLAKGLGKLRRQRWGHA